MAKFWKSLFTSDKRKSGRFDEGEENRNDFTPPLDGRRNLSISRSGRMRQASRKRCSLTMDLYGEKFQTPEKPKSIEYHVNNPKIIGEPIRRRSLENSIATPKHLAETEVKKEKIESERTTSADMVRTPEEEIELAFEVIHKVS